MRVALEPADQPGVVALIAALDAYQDSLYPPEARYALDLGALTQPNVLFAVARDAQGAAVGCGAVVLGGLPGADVGEVKRMYVAPAARGQGVAHQLMQLLEAAAQARGCRTLKLETGPLQPEAIAFYRACGFSVCGAFGSYAEHPLSVFMGKALAPGLLPPKA
ncbi:GNAT family N-acetyltransferase [Ideonella margarita]|uniref:GNAT family N-acetyltransferase n=1 Tax=Ideonella margarita TaxID=2984191 RepID=A0ABU9C9W9_9BURK